MFFKAFYELLIEQSPSYEDILLSNDIFALSFSVFLLLTILFRVLFNKLNP